MKRLGLRHLRFKFAVAAGAALGLLLFVQSFITYYQLSKDVIEAELQRDVRRQVTALQREVLRLGIQEPAGLRQVVEELRQEEPKKIAWIQVIDIAGQTLIQSGNPVGPSFRPDQLQLAYQRGAPVSAVRGTGAAKVLVAAFAVRFAPRPGVASGGQQPARAPAPLSSRRFVELALYWNSASENFGRLRRDLIVSCLAALGLLASMGLLWSRFPYYLRGMQLEQQTEMAHRVQADLLPASGSAFQNLDFAAACVPAWQVGGDFYDVFSTEDGRMAIVVGDVSGDGLPASVVVGLLVGAVRASGWLAGTTEHESSSRQLSELLRARTALDRFASLFWCYYDPGEKVLRYVNAGHPPPLLLRQNSAGERRVERLEEGGPVLGVVPAAQYRQGTAPICPGDLLVLFSDGVVEAANESEEQFGEARLLTAIQEFSQSSAAGIRDEILKRVHSFVGGEQLQDDLTLVVARFQSRHDDTRSSS